MKRTAHRAAFSLVELLVVIGMIALLVALAFPAYSLMILHGDCAACSENMHSCSVAFLSYAMDHNGSFPGRVKTGQGDKWPTLLLSYIGNDPTVYVDPGDQIARSIPPSQIVSNTSNNSSFIFNGFNDLGAYTNPNAVPSLFNIPSTANLILLGQQVAGSNQFYMDFVEGNQTDILKKTAYFGGSNYAFADGSVRFLKLSQYSDSLWLVNSSYVIPTQ